MGGPEAAEEAIAERVAAVSRQAGHPSRWARAASAAAYLTGRRPGHARPRHRMRHRMGVHQRCPPPQQLSCICIRWKSFDGSPRPQRPRLPPAHAQLQPISCSSRQADDRGGYVVCYKCELTAPATGVRTFPLGSRPTVRQARSCVGRPYPLRHRHAGDGRLRDVPPLAPDARARPGRDRRGQRLRRRGRPAEVARRRASTGTWPSRSAGTRWRSWSRPRRPGKPLGPPRRASPGATRHFGAIRVSAAGARGIPR